MNRGHPVLNTKENQLRRAPAPVTRDEELKPMAHQEAIVRLQRLVGNREVQSLLKQKRISQRGSLTNLSPSPTLQRCDCGMDEDEMGNLQLQRAPGIQRFGDDDENSGSWTDAVSSAVSSVSDAASDAVSSATDAVSGAVDAVSDTAAGVASSASDAWNSASDTASNAWNTVSDTASGAANWAGEAAGKAWDAATDAASGVADWIGETAGNAWNAVTDAAGGGGDTVPDGSGGILDAASGLVGNIDPKALTAQAADQVVNETQAPKLPRVQQADSLIAKANEYIKGKVPDSVDLDLPAPPSGASPNECCTPATLQTLRAGIDSPKTDLETALRAFKTAQHNTKIAADDATTTCLSTVISMLVPGIGLFPGGGKPPLTPSGGWGGPIPKGGSPGLAGAAAGVAAAFAACIVCIKAATPVKLAIEAEQKAYDDLIPAMDKLGKAISSYETCAVGTKNCASDQNAPEEEIFIP